MIDFQINDNNFCGDLTGTWVVPNSFIKTMKLANNDWQCPVPDYCDDKKKVCDYSASMHCVSKQLINTATCQFAATHRPIHSVGKLVCDAALISRREVQRRK